MHEGNIWFDRKMIEIYSMEQILLNVICFEWLIFKSKDSNLVTDQSK